MTATDVIRLGDVLRRARLDAGLNQTDLAKQIGVSQSELSRWERGVSEPTLSQTRALADATGAEYLYDLRELPSRCMTMPGDRELVAA